jgi:chromosome segregation ATPase
MTMEPTAPTDAQQRAAEVAEQLAAEGKPVTNRTVRERAGVAMTVAAEAAREWNERAAAEAAVPELPDTVRARLDGIWRAAYVVARDEFTIERDALGSKLRAAEDEIAGFSQDLTEAEARIEKVEVERDAAQAELQRVTRESEQAAAAAVAEQTSLLAVERSRADRAEGALDAVTAERDRLLAELEAARSATSR